MFTQEQLKSILHYDPETGHWTWLVKRSNIKPGMKAGCNNGDGYTRVRAFGKKYLSSRLAYFYMMGKWPTLQIDHINQIKTDDRWKNLREVTCKENIANRNNRVKKKDNGLPLGVRWKSNRYEAATTVNGKKIHIGRFKCVKEAALAYQKFVDSLVMLATILDGG